jgi:hypothetical protein
MTTDLDSLLSEYRSLYWELNELQLIGNEACLELARKVEARMNALAGMIGYHPAC